MDSRTADIVDEVTRLTASGSRRLSSSVAVITGAGMFDRGPIGIGAAIAHLFAAHGASVLVVDAEANRGKLTCASIESAGGTAVLFEADITDPAQCAGAIDRAISEFGKLDILVNNVGITRPGTVENVELDIWETVLRTNVTGAMLLTKAAAPHLARTHGAIVNMASIAAIRSFGSVSYAASKAALIALTRDAAFTLGPRGVRVNCVVPGHLYASMTEDKPAEVREQRRLANVLGTEGTAWDVAAAALFLASSEARWITGTLLPVDAGTTNVTALGMARLRADSPI